MEKLSWNQKFKRQREIRGWSRAYLAECINVDIKTVSRWERGEAFPQSRYHYDLVQLFGVSNAAELGLVEDEDTLSSLQSRNIEDAYLMPDPITAALPTIVQPLTAQDWGESPSMEDCYGRQQESEILKRWILDKRCRMIAILGIGGIGKTTFTTMLAHQISEEFDYVIWRSLENAPPVEQIIAACLQFAPEQQQGNVQGDLNQQCSLLLAFLRKQRCLIILDNVESIFETGQRAGHYLREHAGYGMLLQRIGETDHQSCLLLTSREKPQGMVRMEGKATRVHTFPLKGIGQDEGKQLLQDRDLSGSPLDWAELITIYAGNPLALKLVAERIREIFHGDIASFLAEEEFVSDNIDDLIAQQFQRLTPAEKHILYNLAIEREPTMRLDILESMRYTHLKNVLFDALESLRKRSLVELSEHEYFSLQPVIREYVTAQFVEQISQEIVGAGQAQGLTFKDPDHLPLLHIQPVLKAQAKDYIRQSQEKQIVEPILQSLQRVFGREECITHVKNMLASIHNVPQYKNGYAAGTFLNLLTHLAADLRGLDCSHLAIKQAYLQGIALPDMNFQGADLTGAVFTDTFSSILCLAVSPGGQMLAAGTTTNEVRMWQVDGLVPIFTSEQSSTVHTPQTLLMGQGHTDGLRALAFDPTGRLLASGSEDRTIRLWDTGTGECLDVLKDHTDMVRSLAFSPDGSLLASGSEDQTVRVWDVERRKCCQILRGHTQRVRAVAYSSKGNMLASGGDDGTIRLWDTQTWKSTHILQEHAGYVRTLAFHPEGEILASGGEDRTIRLWHAPTGKCLAILRGHTHRVSALTFASEGALLASSSDDLTICLWDCSDEADPNPHPVRTLSGHEKRIWSLAFVPGKNMLISVAEEQTLRVWDLTSSACIHILRGYTSLIKAIAYSPDGHMLADATEEQFVHVWDVDSGNLLHKMPGHDNRVRDIAFSHNGKLLASGSEDETIRIWNAATGSHIRTLTGHTHLIRSVAFMPDDKTVISSSYDQTIRLWNIATSHNYKTFHGEDGIIWSIAISPDGTTLASGNDNGIVRLWYLQTGEPLKALVGHTHRVWYVTFSPDGTLIASTSDDGKICLWERATGTCIRVFGKNAGAEQAQGIASTEELSDQPMGHTSWTRALSFSPDGRYLASGSHDRTVCIWDVASGECRFQLVGHNNVVWSVAFSPTEPVLASAGDDGTIRLWDSETGAYIKMVGEERPCERMNITDAKGISIAQRQTLLSLGAIDTNA